MMNKQLSSGYDQKANRWYVPIKFLVPLFILIFICGSAISALAAVTISSPQNGATVASPVHCVANASSGHPISLLQIYVDYNAVYTTTSSSLDTYLTLTEGSHRFVVQAQDASGNKFKKIETITVSVSAPAPPPVAVSISPSTAVIQSSTTQQFTASVTGTTNTAVNWFVNGAQGGNAIVGFVSAAGIYTAPVTLPANPSVTVTAQSAYDSSKSANANVTITQSAGTATGTVYYVDSAAGSDSNTGISASAPWRSLSKVNSSSFAPGDQILLKRGSTWHGVLQVPSSGASGSPLKIGAYGTGNRPVLDGTGVAVSSGSGLVLVSGKTYVTLDNLEIRNSVAQGILALNADGFTLTNSVVHDNQQDGIYAWANNSVLIDSNEIYNNNLAASSRYRGITINGSGTTYSNISLTRNKVHDNHGGTDWSNCAEGIYLGNTSSTPPTFHNLVVADNELYLNGNAAQNQNGRGLTGSFNGDISILRNYIHDNASAGAYIGDTGRVIDILYQNNLFKNNHLRAFGWMSNGVIKAYNNTVISSDPSLTGIGIEYATVGTPPEIKNNIFWIVPNSRYGSFYAVHVGSTLPNVGHNIYWDALNGPGSRTFLNGDYSNYANYLTFSQWVSLTNDNSREINPQLLDPYLPDFRLQSTSPAINMGFNLGTVYENALDPRGTIFPFTTVNQNTFGAWAIGAFAYVK